MQVWPGYSAGLADGTQHLALADSFSCFHINAAHVDIERLQTQAVLDEHAIAIEKIVTGFDNDAIGRGDDRGSFGGGNIDTTVGSSGLFIEEALRPKVLETGPARGQSNESAIICSAR